ncbi:MAG: diguanylate cyclase, partial [Candidatus Omnitrophica bacterium]|nr:diguanylate cyclase [Candidatus Omnitrophota bacterium]
AVYTVWIKDLTISRNFNAAVFDLTQTARSRPAFMPSLVDNIILINVDEETLRRVKVRWPWPRTYMADILQKVNNCRPRLVVVDFVFIGKSMLPEEDALFEKALQHTDSLLLASYIDQGGVYVVPEKVFSRYAKGYGFVNKPWDVDDTIRRTRPLIFSRAGAVLDYSLSFKTAALYLGMTPADLLRTVPLQEDNTVPIYFFGGENKFTCISAWKIMSGNFPKAVFKDKLVFFGTTAEIFHDTYQTPVGRMAGVTILANEALMHIEKLYFRFVPRIIEFLVLFILVSCAVQVGMRWAIAKGLVADTSVLIAFSIVAYTLIKKKILMDYFGPFFLVITVSVIIYVIRYASIAIENSILQQQANTDELTGLYNYRFFTARLRIEMDKAKLENTTVAIALLDIDHFKEVNDAYGHEMGNVVLRTIASTIKANVRNDDIVVRYGGEEFCVIMPGIAQDDALQFAERLRRAVKDNRFTVGLDKQLQVTVSVGLSFAGPFGQKKHAAMIIQEADRALYDSKNAGRDRVSSYEV